MEEAKIIYILENGLCADQKDFGFQIDKFFESISNTPQQKKFLLRLQNMPMYSKYYIWNVIEKWSQKLEKEPQKIVQKPQAGNKPKIKIEKINFSNKR